MAKRPSTDTTYQLTGSGLNPDDSLEPLDTTSLPASAVQQESAPSDVGVPQADQAAPQIPQEQPEAQPVNDDGREWSETIPGVDMSLLEDLPVYANGATMETPINISPLGVVDRFKLSLGNKAGTYNYLKQRYDDVKIDSSGNFVILDKDTWYRADADGLGDGDAWARTKEIVKDMVDLTDVGIVTAGQVGGAAVAGPLGGMAGAGLGSFAKSSLGRLVGTYSATGEEEVKDAALEAILGLGGEVIRLGAKPTMKIISKAYHNIAGSAANTSKELLSAAMEKANGYPRWTYRRAMDDPGIVDLANEMLKKAGPKADIVAKNQVIMAEQRSVISALAEKAPKALQQEFSAGVNEIEKAVPKGFMADIGATVRDVGSRISDAGLIKKEVINGRAKYTPYSLEEIAKQLRTTPDQAARMLPPDAISSIAKVAEVINTYGKLPNVKGKTAVRKLLEAKNTMNDVFSGLIDYAPEGSRMRALGAEMKNLSNEAFAQKFADAGVGKKYLAVNKRYSDLADSAKSLQQIKNTPTLQREGMEKQLLTKLANQTGAFKQLQGEANALNTLFKSSHPNAVQRLLDLEASKSFLDLVPKSSGPSDLLSTAFKGGNAALALTGVGGPRGAGRLIKGAAAIGNAGDAAKQLRAAKKVREFADFTKKLGPQKAAEFLSNPNMVREALKVVVSSDSSAPADAYQSPKAQANDTREWQDAPQ